MRNYSHDSQSVSKNENISVKDGNNVIIYSYQKCNFFYYTTRQAIQKNKRNFYVGCVLMKRNFPGLSSVLGMFFVFKPAGKQMK